MSAEHDRSESGDIDPLNPAIKFEDDITITLPQARFHHKYSFGGPGGFIRNWKRVEYLPDEVRPENARIELVSRSYGREVTWHKHEEFIAEGTVVYEGPQIDERGKKIGRIRKTHDHNGNSTLISGLPVSVVITPHK